MKTLTFYSYKGGVGRTLAVANFARYLALLNQKVVVLDFDLEAPGLHSKFGLVDEHGETPLVIKGFIDLLLGYLKNGEMRLTSPDEYFIRISADTNQQPNTTEYIYFLPAGKAPSIDYWRKLAQINWHELFYGDEQLGLKFFVDFKKSIESLLQPDYLIIDARTGVSELGGIATSLLSDIVFGMFINNPENIVGIRKFFIALKQTKRLPNQTDIEMIPILSRIPIELTDINGLTKKILTELNEEQTIFSNLYYLHSSKSLELQERVLLNGIPRKNIEPLYLDYLSLFIKAIGQDVIQTPSLKSWFYELSLQFLDDPEFVTKEFENMILLLPQIEILLMLLKIYRARRFQHQEITQRINIDHLLNTNTSIAFWEDLLGSLTDYPPFRELQSNIINRLIQKWKSDLRVFPGIGKLIAQQLFQVENNNKQQYINDIALFIQQSPIIKTLDQDKLIEFIHFFHLCNVPNQVKSLLQLLAPESKTKIEADLQMMPIQIV